MKVYRQFVEKAQLVESNARLAVLKGLIRRDPNMNSSLAAEISYHTQQIETCKRMRLMVQPGNTHPEVKEWQCHVATPTGLVPGPRMISVEFVEGVAEVENKLGEYLIESGEAFKKPQPVVHVGDY